MTGLLAIDERPRKFVKGTIAKQTYEEMDGLEE